MQALWPFLILCRMPLMYMRGGKKQQKSLGELTAAAVAVVFYANSCHVCYYLFHETAVAAAEVSPHTQSLCAWCIVPFPFRYSCIFYYINNNRMFHFLPRSIIDERKNSRIYSKKKTRIEIQFYIFVIALISSHTHF